jgi:hypothetical protein
MSAVVISVVEGWPMGQSVEDLAEYAMAQGAEGYEVHEVRLCRCAVCGGEVFDLNAIEEFARAHADEAKPCASP